MIHRTLEPPSVGDVFRPASSSRHPGTRGSRVLLRLHDDCAECRTWVREELHRVEDDLAGWDARVVRLASESPAEATWLAVVDEWDQVFHVVPVGADHTFPEPSDLVEWVRFVAIQCPECEGPEGPWRQ